MGDCFVKEEDGYAQGFNSQLKLKSNPISAFRVVGLIVLVWSLASIGYFASRVHFLVSADGYSL